MAFWDLFFPVAPDISMAAFFGTIARLLDGEKRGKTRMVTLVIANYLIAIYFTELIGELTGWKAYKGISFAIGFGGFAIVEGFINKTFDKIAENIKLSKNGKSDSSLE
jgi:hypothetical protein